MKGTAGDASDRREEPTAASSRRLWLYGLAMLVPAAYFAVRYPLRGNIGNRLYDIGKLAHYGVDEFVWFCLGVGSLFVLYALAVRESRRLPPRVALRPVFGCGALLALLFAWMYPVNAIDIFIYAVRSRLWTEYGENPNAAFPVVHWDTDRYMHFASEEWADDTSPYGPLWNLVAAPATLIGGDEIAVALAVFKVIAVVCILLGAWVIAKTLAVAQPADAATGALIFLWNPLVLWEGVANGHNDVVLALLLLLAMLAWARRWNGLVVPLLVAAALIKYVSLLLLPLAAVALWRRSRGWRERRAVALQSLAGSFLVAVVGFAPFYNLRAVIDSVERQGELISTSPAGLAIGLLGDRFAEPGLTDTVKLIGLGILLLALGWLLADVWVNPEKLPRAAFEILAIFLLAATWNFRNWYLIWPAALVALLPLGWPFWRMFAWTFGGVIVYGHYIWIWRWTDFDYNTARNVGVLITFLPVALLSLAEFIRAILPRATTVDSPPSRRPEPAGADRTP